MRGKHFPNTIMTSSLKGLSYPNMSLVAGRRTLIDTTKSHKPIAQVAPVIFFCSYQRQCDPESAIFTTFLKRNVDLHRADLFPKHNGS